MIMSIHTVELIADSDEDFATVKDYANKVIGPSGELSSKEMTRTDESEDRKIVVRTSGVLNFTKTSNPDGSSDISLSHTENRE